MKRYMNTLLGLLAYCVLINQVTAEVTSEELYDRPRPTPAIIWSLERATQRGAISEGSITFNVPVDPNSTQLFMIGGTLQELHQNLNKNGLLASIDYAFTVDTQLKAQPLISVVIDERDERKPHISSYQLEVSDFSPELPPLVNGLVIMPASTNREEE